MDKKQAHFLGERPTGELLYKLSLPAAIGMIVNATYNLVDAIFVGQGPGAMALAGLSIAFPIQMLVGAVALTIGVGSAALISIRLGEKKPHEAARIAGSAQVTGLLLAFVLLLILLWQQEPILALFGANRAILPYARDYVSMVMWGFPLLSSLMIGNNLLRSEGKANLAMTSMLISTGVNIVLDPIFIFPRGEFYIGYFGMGIRGAALATVISQGMGFMFLLVLYLRKTSALPLKLSYFRPDFPVLWQALILGFPNFIRNAGTSLLALIINRSLVHYGSELLVSSYGIINRIMMFSLMPIFGVVQGFQPIAGYNFGARLYERLRSVFRQALLSTTLISTFFFVLLFFFPRLLIRLFTPDPELIRLTVDFLRVVVILFPLLGFQFIGASYFQSIGKKKPSLFLGLIRQIIFLPLLVLVLPVFFGVKGIPLAFPVADLLASLITFAMLRAEWKTL